mmetsp:Transcript_20543/g.23268  ORF Transcript_20543/g.23268 Transcript_20543/m.23268 type:complete len:198 (-) Transcript_20543:51-644(-)
MSEAAVKKCSNGKPISIGTVFTPTSRAPKKVNFGTPVENLKTTTETIKFATEGGGYQTQPSNFSKTPKPHKSSPKTTTTTSKTTSVLKKAKTTLFANGNTSAAYNDFILDVKKNIQVEQLNLKKIRQKSVDLDQNMVRPFDSDTDRMGQRHKEYEELTGVGLKAPRDSIEIRANVFSGECEAEDNVGFEHGGIQLKH